MLLMPPRSRQEQNSSLPRMFPAWHLGRTTRDHELIACAYNVSLADVVQSRR
jgi:hypothetical protein